MPVSGKQFNNNIPYGSYIDLKSVKEEVVVGVQWYNEACGTVVDIDLSLTNESSKLGWNSEFVNADAVYSGDVVNGDNGAVELFLLKNTNRATAYAVNVNLFTVNKNIPYSFFIAKPNTDYHPYKNTMVDPNTIMYQAPQLIGVNGNQQNTIGILTEDKFIIDVLPSSKNVSGIPPATYMDAVVKYMTSKLTVDVIPLGESNTPLEECEHKLDLNNPSKDILMLLVK